MFGRRKTPDEPEINWVRFDVAWGGYYTSRDEDGQWGVFRLLDFNRDAYHSTLYDQRFPEPPTLEMAKSLTPFALHVPIAAGQLVNFPATLIGESPLALDDLEGYDVYLEHAAGLGAEERQAFLAKLVGFGTEPTLAFLLAFDEHGQLQIKQAE